MAATQTDNACLMTHLSSEKIAQFHAQLRKGPMHFLCELSLRGLPFESQGKQVQPAPVATAHLKTACCASLSFSHRCSMSSVSGSSLKWMVAEFHTFEYALGSLTATFNSRFPKFGRR